MQTHRETVLQQVAATIAGSTPVFRSRQEAFARDELPAIVVKPGGEQNERLGTRVVKRTFQFLVEVHSRADTTECLTADQVADPVLAGIHAALFAGKGTASWAFVGTLADLLEREMQEPQFTDGDETRVGITVVYEAIYATTELDITTLTNH